MTMFDALPPNDIQAEESVLGALMVDPSAAGKVETIVTAADFFREHNGWTFDACMRPVYPNDYNPPSGRNYFTFRLSSNGQRRRDVSIGCLSDEELAWINRVIQAEQGRRNAL